MEGNLPGEKEPTGLGGEKERERERERERAKERESSNQRQGRLQGSACEGHAQCPCVVAGAGSAAPEL